jgi:putative transposase
MMYVRFPLSLRQVEDLLHERGIDICHETVRAWWNRFGPVFASGIRRDGMSIHHHLSDTTLGAFTAGTLIE